MIPDPEQEMDMMSPEHLITAENKEAMRHVVSEGTPTDPRWGDTLSFSNRNCNGLKSIKYV